LLSLLLPHLAEVLAIACNVVAAHVPVHQRLQCDRRRQLQAAQASTTQPLSNARAIKGPVRCCSSLLSNNIPRPKLAELNRRVEAGAYALLATSAAVVLPVYRCWCPCHSILSYADPVTCPFFQTF
jgi:hypothetical protein